MSEVCSRMGELSFNFFFNVEVSFSFVELHAQSRHFFLRDGR